DYVVLARLTVPRQDQIEIEKSWPLHGDNPEPLEGIIQVRDLKLLPLPPGEREYLIPLRRVRRQYELAPLAGRSSRLPIYPATSRSQSDLQQLLEQLHRRTP